MEGYHDSEISQAEEDSSEVNSIFPLESMQFANGQVEFRNIVPENFRKNGKTPLVTLIGMGMKNQDVGQFVSQGLYEVGQYVIPLDFPGTGVLVEGEKGTSPELNRQAELFADFLAQLPQEQVDICGTSMATITVLTMLERHPELIDKIGKVVLTMPIGLGGKDNLFKLGYRQLREILRDKRVEKNEERQKINEMVAQNLKEHGENKGRQWKEIKAIAGSDLYPALGRLRSKGVRIALMQGELDLLNSNRRVWKRMGQGNESAWKKLEDKDYQENKDEYDKRGIKPGQKVWNRNAQIVTPPIESITMSAGGHEMYGPKDFAKKIIRVLDSLDGDNPKSIQTIDEDLSASMVQEESREPSGDELQ